MKKILFALIMIMIMAMSGCVAYTKAELVKKRPQIVLITVEEGKILRSYLIKDYMRVEDGKIGDIYLVEVDTFLWWTLNEILEKAKE